VVEREQLGLSSADTAALFVGGDWERKGLDIAIQAVAQAGWKLIVVGRGDIGSWEECARAHGAKVVFCGHLARPERIYCAADAFVLPSRYEGFALVAIEAAASGLPLLVTGATGAGALAVSAGLDPLPREVGAFATGLIALGGDPELRQDIGTKARVAAQQLSWQRVVAAYANVLELAEAAVNSPVAI
jgi:glycosyltransferase involved in cell wall biosynthesis